MAETISEKKSVQKSEAVIAFEKIIEAYKKSNPKKYEIKKDELAKKLAAIK